MNAGKFIIQISFFSKKHLRKNLTSASKHRMNGQV